PVAVNIARTPASLLPWPPAGRGRAMRLFRERGWAAASGSHGEGEHRAGRVADDALGGAAAQCVENAVMPRRRHADQIAVEFDGRLHDRLYDRTGANDHRWQAGRVRDNRRRRLSDVKEIDGEARAGQEPTEAQNSFDRSACGRGEIDRNQGAAQLNMATDRIDKAAGAWRDEQRRDPRAAEHGFRHRTLEPMRNALAGV